MTLTLSFPPETEARLAGSAAASGKDVETIVREAVDQTLAAEANTSHSEKMAPRSGSPNSWPG